MKLAKGSEQTYEASIEAASDQALTVKAVAGVDVPGLSELRLRSIKLKNGSAGQSLSAQLDLFDTTGEIDVFHPNGSDAAVLAVTLDGELDFTKLIPGNALAGGNLFKPTMLIVPSGMTLPPDDASIPADLKANIQTVLNDLEASDPGVKSRAIPAGITLLAELDIQGSSDMGALMSSAGVPSADANRFPMKGTISPAMFQPNASLGERLDGTKLKLALPDLQIPSLPGAMQLSQALLNISDKLPEDFALPEANTPASGPVVSLSARAAADSAKGLWDFQDLKATSVNFAATYSKEAWAFNLQGTAELNDTPLAYTMKPVSYTHLTLPTKRIV